MIDGQKIWTGGARHRDYGLLLARTDPTVPKHAGLTMFFLSMRSPGVEIRPIRQASGESGFNEVFFTGVRVPNRRRLGAVGAGRQVALAAPMNERLSIGANAQAGFPELFEWLRGRQGAAGPALDAPRWPPSWPPGPCATVG